MKLLFDENTASSELKELLGFLDADFDFPNIKPDIITATREVIALVGKEVYEKAVLAYYEEEIEPEEESEDETELEEESEEETEFEEEVEPKVYDIKDFLFAIRYPIAVNAYRLYAPSNDLSHTNNGRKMRMDDHEKNAFEWMIDRDNEAQEKRYYRALDDLLSFLEENEVPEWLNSENYKKAKLLLVSSTKDFDSVFPIESRLLYQKLVPGLLQCQHYEILPRISKEKLQEMQEIPLSEENEELHRHIKEAMVYYAMAWAFPRYSVTLFPEGVLQYYKSDRATTQVKKPALMKEPEWVAQSFTSDAQKAFREIERLMTPAPEVNPDQNINPKTIKGNKFISM